jgi:serine/threonine-protein kinase
MADALRYHAVRKIADGGSAEVFLGEQQGAAGFKRPVVLKRIRPELYADSQYREMLVEEARLSMSLHHSNLVEVLDVGESGGRYFLVLELVDGWTLHQLMRRARDMGHPLPPALAVYIVGEVCRALAYAHARTDEHGVPLNIVHRDVCPNNVLVSMHAEVKLADFGIARARTRTPITRIGMIKGKPAYMSPEQTRAEPLDARSDLFSVGTVLYNLLTDHQPFPGPSDQELLVQISNTDVASPATVRPELPKELCKLVLKAMSRKKDDRFASAEEMMRALEQVQRTVLEPAGRSELETWLRTLSAKDGATAITRQPMPPAASQQADDAEWISLSAEQAIHEVRDQTATQRALPNFDAPAPRRRSPVVLAVAALLVLGAAGWWLTSSPSRELTPTEAPPVDAGTLVREPAKLVEAEEELPAPAPTPAATTAPTADDAGQLAVAEPAPEPTAPEVAPEPSEPEPTRADAPSRSGVPGLKLTAKLAPNQKPDAKMIAVVFESEPPGVLIKVDKRELGHTPATLSFKNGLTFNLTFVAKGKPPLKQWLMLTEREGRLPKVTLRDPVPQ